MNRTCHSLATIDKLRSPMITLMLVLDKVALSLTGWANNLAIQQFSN